MQDISKAIQAGINLLEGKDRLPIAPSDIEALAELKGLLKALMLGKIVVASPDRIIKDEPKEGDQ